MDKKLMESPNDDIMVGNPANRRGGEGTYDGISGLPARTHSPNAVPEKLIDACPPLPKGKE